MTFWGGGDVPQGEKQQNVGLANGQQSVALDVALQFNVTEASATLVGSSSSTTTTVTTTTTTTDKTWGSEWDNKWFYSNGGGNGGDNRVTISDDPVPLSPSVQEELVDIIDEEVPLSDIPLTGDASTIWYALSLLSGGGLAGLAVVGKKRKDA